MTEVIYATPDELRRQIDKQGMESSASDPALMILVGAASRLIDSYYNRPDGFTADQQMSTRIYKGSDAAHLWIEETIAIDSIAAGANPKDISPVNIDPATYIGFRGSADNPRFSRLPYLGVMLFEDYFDAYKYYFVEGQWGYAPRPPSSVKQLVIAIAARYYKQGEGAWSDTLGSVDVGRLIFKSQNSDLQWLLEKSRLYKPSVV